MTDDNVVHIRQGKHAKDDGIGLAEWVHLRKPPEYRMAQRFVEALKHAERRGYRTAMMECKSIAAAEEMNSPWSEDPHSDLNVGWEMSAASIWAIINTRDEEST